MEFTEPSYIIPGRLTVGAALFCGPPKLGKSWYCLGLGLACVNDFDVLYLALEDTAKRLQGRLKTVLDRRQAPDNFYIYTQWPKLDEGGTGQLNDFLRDHPNCKLVMVDTLAKVRHKRGKNNGLYEDDYEAITGLKMIADRHNIAIVLVHHVNKSKPADILESVSGTTGLTGAADTIMILGRERGQSDGTLFITGRDVEEQDIAMSFDSKTCTWIEMGQAQDYRISKERQEILDIMKREGKPLSPADIAKITGKNKSTTKNLIYSLLDSQLITQISFGKYIVRSLYSLSSKKEGIETAKTTETTVHRDYRDYHNNNIYIDDIDNDIDNNSNKGDAWEPDDCNILPFTDDEIPF
jgi:hypothetical protein